VGFKVSLLLGRNKKEFKKSGVEIKIRKPNIWVFPILCININHKTQEEQFNFFADIKLNFLLWFNNKRPKNIRIYRFSSLNSASFLIIA